MSVRRHAPDLAALFRALAGHSVRYVVTGSSAGLLLGLDVAPGDLDITPDLDVHNLERLAAALETIEAKPDPDGPFGDWAIQADGEWGWVQRDPRPGEQEARRTWRPDPSRPEDFDELLTTRHGALDVVPTVAGRFADLAPRAITVRAFGQTILVESIEDQLDTLTVARRRKDRDRVRALRALQKLR